MFSYDSIGNMHDVAHFKNDQRRSQNRKISERIQKRHRRHGSRNNFQAIQSAARQKKKKTRRRSSEHLSDNMLNKSVTHFDYTYNYFVTYPPSIMENIEHDDVTVIMLMGAGRWACVDAMDVETHPTVVNSVNVVSTFVNLDSLLPLDDIQVQVAATSNRQLISRLAYKVKGFNIWEQIWSYLVLSTADKCELRWQCTTFQKTVPVPRNYRYMCVSSLPDSSGDLPFGISSSCAHRLLTKIFGSDWIPNSSHGIKCTSIERIPLPRRRAYEYTNEVVETAVSEWRVNPVVQTFDVKFWHGIVRTNVPWNEIRFNCCTSYNSSAAKNYSIGLYSSSSIDRKYYRKQHLKYNRLGLRDVFDVLRLGAMPTGVSAVWYWRYYWDPRWGIRRSSLKEYISLSY